MCVCVCVCTYSYIIQYHYTYNIICCTKCGFKLELSYPL